VSGVVPLLPLHVFMVLVTEALGLTLFVYVIIYSWCSSRHCRPGYWASSG